MRFAAHLFGMPGVFVLAAYLLLNASEGAVGDKFLHTFEPYLRQASLASLLIGVILFSYNAWRVWQAHNGVGEICYSCSMPTSHKHGRYGPYFKCWNCGTNRADRG